jgi:peptide chain release factor 1
MDADTKPTFKLNRSEVDKKYCRSGGKGGQKVNKVETCVVLTHLPTGIMVRSEENRTRGKNEEAAWVRLEEKLKTIYNSGVEQQIKQKRFDQIGHGDRNDKRRTYRIQDGFVLDHVTGKQITVKELYKGLIKNLHRD